MAVIKITEQQKQRLLELYNTPTSELKSRDIPAIIEQEMGFKVPYTLLNDFYQRGFGLDISNRKRKTEVVTFEFENGKSFQLNNAEPQEEDQVVPNVVSNQTEPTEKEEEVVAETQEEPVSQWGTEYQQHPKEPSKFEF